MMKKKMKRKIMIENEEVEVHLTVLNEICKPIALSHRIETLVKETFTFLFSFLLGASYLCLEWSYLLLVPLFSHSFLKMFFEYFTAHPILSDCYFLSFSFVFTASSLYLIFSLFCSYCISISSKFSFSMPPRLFL